MNYSSVTKNITAQLQRDCDWNCMTKKTKLICKFKGIFVRFKKLICTFNVFRKFATARRRPERSSCVVFI